MDEIYPKNSLDINVRYIWDIGEICPRCTWDVPETEIFPRYTRDILEDIYDISKRYPRDISKIWKIYAWNLLLISLGNTCDIPEFYLEYALEILLIVFTSYARDIPKIFTRYIWDIPKI